MTENSNALKNLINSAVVKKISSAVSLIYPEFNQRRFQLLLKVMPELALKARVLLITKHLKDELPTDYSESLKILLNIMKTKDLKGFELWPFSEFISQFGLDHFDESMEAMYVLTKGFTAEFAIRPFLLKDHKKVLKYFVKWSSDKDVHVRRWISEGSRPLLPWGQRIPLFIMDPTHTLLLLDKLRFDEELYVRKSVANHLNDISKNHPQVVIEILRMWKRDVPTAHTSKIEWISRHALRSLIKQGLEGALKLMGAVKAEIELNDLRLNKKRFKINDLILFDFEIFFTSKKVQKLIVDYSIDFMKANGKKSKKVFKLKTLQINPGEILHLTKSHSLKPITTNKYYSGTHYLKIQVNGEILSEIKFSLAINSKV